MNRIASVAGAVLLVASLPSVTSAGWLSKLDFTGKLTDVSFNNYEIVLDDVQSTDPGVIKDTEGNPVQFADGKYYKEIVLDPKVPDLPSPGDVVVQILNAGDVYINGVKKTPYGPNDELTAYLLMNVDTVDTTTGYITYKVAASDPFGVLDTTNDLANGVVTRWYGENEMDFSSVNSGAKSSLYEAWKNNIDTVTDGTAWVEFGLAGAADGTGYTAADTKVYSTPKVGGIDSIAQLNVIQYDLTPGLTFFDPGQFETLLGDTRKTSLESKAGIYKHGNPPFQDGKQLVDGYSAWRLMSEDPTYLKMTPEPGAVAALVGMLAVCLAAAVIRRFRK